MDWLAERLSAYGLDARARSALKAFARNAEGAAALARGQAALLEALATGHQGDADQGALHESAVRFLQLFVALPGEDFAPDWLSRLTDAWRDLRRHGGPPDFPLRAANALHACALSTLLGRENSLSRLELEISNALSAAAAFVAGLLVEASAQADTSMALELAGPEGHWRLTSCVALELDQLSAGPVGLLVGRFVLGSAALTWEAGLREERCQGVLERIRAVLRAEDTLVRTERQAFAVILPRLQTDAQVAMAAHKIVQAVETPLVFDDQPVKALVQLGAAWAPEHGDSAGALIRAAEMAADEGRRLGKPVHSFDAELKEKVHEEARLEQELVLAMDNGLLDIHIQPQVCLRTGAVTGGEALLRWRDSGGQMVPPYRAPEIAERLGLGAQLRRWLIHRGCRLLAHFRDAGLAVNLSVNLTAADLGDPELPLMVGQALRLWKAPATQLTFELTETAMLENPVATARVMAQLRDLGVATSIDDFGTGYSSVAYLRELPLSEVKIDRVFVATALESARDREIIKALIQLAHALDLEVVAEGVEDEATLLLLRALDCDRAQGYWISRAMPTDDFPDWLAAWAGSFAAAALLA